MGWQRRGEEVTIRSNYDVLKALSSELSSSISWPDVLILEYFDAGVLTGEINDY